MFIMNRTFVCYDRTIGIITFQLCGKPSTFKTAKISKKSSKYFARLTVFVKFRFDKTKDAFLEYKIGY